MDCTLPVPSCFCLADGVILNKMINKTFPETVDERQLCKKAKKYAFEININFIIFSGEKIIERRGE